MRWLGFVALLAACFSPQPEAGAPCSVTDECPAGLSCRFGVCATDDSFSASVAFATDAAAVDELAGTIEVHVTLSTPALVPVSVSYAATGGTATADADFMLAPGVLEFAPGETDKTFDLAIIVDILAEPDETIELTLSDVSGGLLAAATETVTIGANLLPRVTFTAGSSDVLESMSTPIEVTLDRPSPFAVTVDYTLTGTSTAPDRTLTSGTLQFAIGETTKMLAPGVVNDLLDEDDETIIITLSNPTNVDLGVTPAHTYTILDNDAMPVVSLSTTSSSINETSISITFNVTLNVVSGRTVTVPFSAGAASTATGAADYNYNTASPLTFAAGTTLKTITIAMINDTTAEADETVLTTLGTPTNATLSANPVHTLTIIDDDRTCYGAGNTTVCLAAPTGALTLPATFNTDISGLCSATQPLTWTSQGQPAVCMIARDTIAVSALTKVSGTRPLLLVAATSIDITSTLDVASRRGGTAGPAASSASCGAFLVTPGNNNTGAGGGAGGTFLSRGGAGGAGDNFGAGGGSAPNPSAAPSILRGGCDGQLAGKAGNNNPGAVGKGGGALYVITPGTLTITGTIDASGSSGTGGTAIAGGSGGGSGGMIKLYAGALNATGGTLMANGGGAACGGGAASLGVSGSDPSVATSPAFGGSGTGGSGGNGFATGFAATAGFAAPSGSGGGGGGGGGGYIQSNIVLTGATVSAGLVQ